MRSTTMGLGFDPSIPNKDTAVVQNLDPESLRPISAGPTVVNATTDEIYTNGNATGEDANEDINNESQLEPGTNYTGKLTFLSSKGLGRKARLHVALASNGKIKPLYRTKIKNCDRNGISEYDEILRFQAPPEANLIIGATLYRLLRRNEQSGIVQIPLNDPAINKGKIINTNLGKATINFRLNYPGEEVVEGSESLELSSDYHYPDDDDSRYEEKMYDAKDVVV